MRVYEQVVRRYLFINERCLYGAAEEPLLWYDSFIWVAGIAAMVEYLVALGIACLQAFLGCSREAGFWRHGCRFGMRRTSITLQEAPNDGLALWLRSSSDDEDKFYHSCLHVNATRDVELVALSKVQYLSEIDVEKAEGSYLTHTACMPSSSRYLWQVRPRGYVGRCGQVPCLPSLS